MMIRDTEDAATYLEGDPNYRVLRRLKLPELQRYAPDARIHSGVVVDVETDGLDLAIHEAVELCLWPFTFATHPAGPMFAQFGEPVRMLQEPANPMPAAMTKIHGLTDADLKGQRFDQEKIAEVVGGSALVIAHHAQFDRGFCEKASPIFRAANWACSMDQVPWKANGFSSNSLENICTKLGAFYDAHQATNDCRAVLFALSHQVGDKTGLQHVIEATRRKSWHVFAHEAPIHLKDLLKARGYKWADGSEAGRPKCWHKEIAEDLAAEQDWLDAKIYKGFRLVPYEVKDVGAKDRFTTRG